MSDSNRDRLRIIVDLRALGYIDISDEAFAAILARHQPDVADAGVMDVRDAAAEWLDNESTRPHRGSHARSEVAPNLVSAPSFDRSVFPVRGSSTVDTSL